MGDEKRELKAGGRLFMTLTNNDTGDVVLKEEHEVVEASGVKGATRGAAGAADQPQLDTRLVSQEWLDPELEKLNNELAQQKSGQLRGAKEAVDAGKLGLDIAKFAWDVIKANKAVTDAKATTTSVLYKGTSGMDYQSAKTTKASSYTLSVHDSLIKGWELIHADITCEGTYGATPRAPGIPEGHYLPAINLYSPRAKADFPCQVSVTAEVSDVSNMGTGKIDPMVTILSTINYGWIAQRRHLVLKFTARGSQGLRRT